MSDLLKYLSTGRDHQQLFLGIAFSARPDTDGERHN